MVDLSKLEKQTKKVINLKDAIIEHDNNKFIEYLVEDGSTFGFGLFKEDEVAVQRAFFSKGTIFPLHQHNEHEYVMVYRGKLKIMCEGDSKNVYCIKDSKAADFICPIDLGIGDCVYFPSNTIHGQTALKDTWAILITIPADKEGFPDVK